LTQLHDKSLLVVERGADAHGTAAPPRYRMLETVRQFALQKLEDSGEADATRARHAEHFLALAQAAAPNLRGPQQSVWMTRLRAEHENLAAAMMWCTHAPAHAAADPARALSGLRMAAASGRYWLFHDVELGCRLVREALQRAPADADDAARFQALQMLAAMYMHRGQGHAGLPHAREALAVAERLGHAEWQAIALGTIGTCLDRGGGDREAALHHYRLARDLARASASAVPLASALNNIANIEFGQGNLQSATDGLRQALHLSRASGDVRTALIELHNLVRVLVAARDHDAARGYAIEAELLLRGVEEHALKHELLEVTAALASSRGEHPFAARLWGATLQRYRHLGYQRPEQDQALLEHRLAQSRQALGDAEFAAAEAAGQALEVDAALIELRQWLARRPDGATA
jgi:tetratricopeptide (TPR) repeat protein